MSTLDEVLRRPGGDPVLRCLALIHGASCVGQFEAVAELHRIGDELGLPPRARTEAALQVVAYGGYPRAIEGLGVLARHVGDADGRSAADGEASAAGQRAARGREVWDRIYAGSAEDVLATLEGLAAGFSEWVLHDAYGRVLARPGLDLAEREILAVAALTLMALPSPLGSHIRGALRNGSPTEVVMDTLLTCRTLAGPEASPVLDQAVDRLSRNVYRA